MEEVARNKKNKIDYGSAYFIEQNITDAILHIEQIPLEVLWKVENPFKKQLLVEAYRIQWEIYQKKYPSYMDERIPLCEMARQAEEEGRYYQESFNESSNFFPGHEVEIIPSFQTRTSKYLRHCYFCRENILPGERYQIHRPLVIDKTTKTSYVLKNSILLKEECGHHMFETVQELDALFYGVNHWYDFELEDVAGDVLSRWYPEGRTPISFSHFATLPEASKASSLLLQPLSKRREMPMFNPFSSRNLDYFLDKMPLPSGNGWNNTSFKAKDQAVYLQLLREQNRALLLETLAEYYPVAFRSKQGKEAEKILARKTRERYG